MSRNSAGSINGAVTKTKVVELVRGEVRYHGVHAILSVKHNGRND